MHGAQSQHRLSQELGGVKAFCNFDNGRSNCKMCTFKIKSFKYRFFFVSLDSNNTNKKTH